eukprot:CAMPEP_0113989580 /NCGR_PEP_ID=MMETSP0328-20130328/8107_1 /TAXON_ID=39455 /ORGANISM="Alexandrium minutum" /LENGTH=41 /assembly_acc=CAM_ASM_000350
MTAMSIKPALSMDITAPESGGHWTQFKLTESAWYFPRAKAN